MPANEAFWLELYDLPPYQEGAPHYNEIWTLTESIQNDGKMRALDIMRLQRIIKLAYLCGKLESSE